MDEARSLTYSINVEANTAQAEANIRNITSNLGSLQSGGSQIRVDANTASAESGVRRVTGNLGDLQTQSKSVGSAFRSSFLEGVDSGNSFASSLKAGIGGAFSYVKGEASDFKSNIVSTAQSIGNGFAHPIEKIKGGLGKALDSVKDKFVNMARSAETASDGTEDLGDAAGDAQKDVKEIGNEAERSGGKFEKLGSIAKTAGLAIGAALGVAVGAVGAFAYSAVDTGMEFDSAMSQISATMGMTSIDIANNVNGAGDTFEALRDKAKEMGAATNFSATEAAEGLNILAMSGYDATSSMGMIEDVLHLAAAGGMEMSQSADFIAGSMKGFNDETKDSAYYADLMAKGATLANTSVTELGEAMSGGAATAAAYGQGADSMTLSLLRLAEQGVAGSAASTSLNAAMKDLYTPTDNAKKALSELGIAVYDENGKAREFNTVVNELNGALSDMSDEEANAYKSMIFQIQGLQAFNKMTVTSTEKQEEWAAALAEASGEASRQYATMTDNLQGDIDIWNSALDGFKIAISDELTPTIREFVQFGSTSMGKLTEAFEVGGISGAMGTLGEILSDGLAMLIDVLPSVIDAGMQLIGALGQGLIDNLPLIIDAVMQIIGSIGQGILDGLPMFISAAAQIIVSLATGLGQALPDLIPTVIEALLLVVSTLIENLPLILDAGMQLVGGLSEGILAAIPLLIEQLPELILQVVNFLTENLPTILEQGSQMIMTLATGILNALPDLVAQLPAIITGIVGFVTENLPLIVETGINLLVQLGLGIIQAIPQLVAQLPAIISAIVDGLAQLPGMMVEIGGNIVRGLWEGIKGLAGWIWDQVSGWASSLWDGICGFFGIHSPSTKFAWAGEMMVEGLAGSIDKNGSEAVAAVEGMAEDIGKVIDSADYEISPAVLDIKMPNAPEVNPLVSDVYYDVKPVVESLNPPVVDDVKALKTTEVIPNGATAGAAISDVSYKVSPIVEDINAPSVSDIYYGVKPVIDSFNPPDVSAEAVYSENAPEVNPNGATVGADSAGVSDAPAFAPVITIQVQGNMDEKATEDLKTSLYETVRELFAEFKEEELERMALKNQYAY